MESVDSGFYAVYCLESVNPRYPNHSYIGFTVNPRQRLRQHNGDLSNGALQTTKRRPWKMVLCVHGFTAKVLALQFEWAWQNPERSRAVRDAYVRTVKGRQGCKQRHTVQHNFAVLHLLLREEPFSRLRLTLNVFEAERYSQLQERVGLAGDRRGRPPAVTVPSLSPEVAVTRSDFDELDRVMAGVLADRAELPDDGLSGLCVLCLAQLPPDIRLTCASESCRLAAHPRCLARTFYAFQSAPTLVPRSPAPCPVCGELLRWADLVLRTKECARKRRREEMSGAMQSLRDTRRRLREEQRELWLSQQSQTTALAP
eukprot:TRINITY_DN39416_c0_g1_i1.p1 TRINITY_DN39416_c0_g1~~TRINITY_DN39416_c0_g1_i1.p1  ORF type:complete len:331 (+),score=108.56 TRINITY_DN39416_c0_g1_i1:52-993(+)